MNKTSTGVIIGLILVIGGIFILYRNGGENTVNSPAENPAINTNVDAEQPTNSNPSTNTSGSSAGASNGSASVPSQAKTYTLAEVALHASSSSCWSVVNGGVYDLTNWIKQHPGGADKIIAICGKDGSASFNSQHEGAPKQANILAGFKIGVLAN